MSEAYRAREDFDHAVAEALEAATAYYANAELLMSDAEYDVLIERIETTVLEHPDWDTRGLLDNVAAGVTISGDVVHPVPMLSLGKTKDLAEVREFAQKATEAGSTSTATEFKLDGMAVRATYTQGVLAQVATRGNGQVGEDVTIQCNNILGLPVRLSVPHSTASFEVRGEVYMTDAQYMIANEQRVAAGKNIFANSRNAVAGILRTLPENTVESSDTRAVLTFAAYDVSGEDFDAVDSYLTRMETLHNTFGIKTAGSLLEDINPADEPSKVIDAIESRRTSLGFQIDGAVVKVDSYAARETLGEVSRHPRWAIAFKFPPEEGTSTLRSIEVTVGKTGRMAIIGHIDPVVVGGVTISKASLHNFSWLTASGMNVGSKVLVSRRNDVIPYLSPLTGGNEKIKPYTPPAVCPQCGGEINKSTLLWRCISSECSVVAALAYWASRDCLDIDRLGETVCEALVDAGLVNNVADLYDLTENQLASLPMGETATGNVRVLGEANAKEIIAGLTRSKSQPFNRVITGLSIPMTGRTVGRWLANEFKNMDALRSATIEEIAEIDKMGTIKAQSVVDGLKKLSPIIDRLIAHGLTMSVPEETGTKPFEGKTYVVSGTVPGYTRNTINERIEELGGTASSSVSRSTTALVTSETTTSKAKKANELGIPIIDPEEFARLVQ